MAMDVGASTEGDPAGDSVGDGSDGPVLAFGDPEIDRLGGAGGDVEVHAETTRSNAISGNDGARGDPIRARYQARTGSLRARQRFFGGGVSGGTVRPCAESSISLASRRSRVASFFALITQ